MNLFALTRDSARRVLRVPLSAEVQRDVDAAFEAQEKAFLAAAEEEIVFDGKYKPDDGECLIIDDFDDIDNLHDAVANPLGVPELSPVASEFQGIKALFSGRSTHSGRVVLIQNFEKRRIISVSGISLFFNNTTYHKIDGIGLSLDTKLAIILNDRKMKFFSFFQARSIFDLTDHYRTATDEDLKSFAAGESVTVDNEDNFRSIADTWVRRKVALVMQSAILDEIDLDEAKKSAIEFDVVLNIKVVDGRNTLVLPDNKAELKKVLRFIDEDYFSSILRRTPHVSNSKTPVVIG